MTKLQITVPNHQKVFVLRNGDLVRGSSGVGSNIQIYDSNTGRIKRNLTSSHTWPFVFGQLSNGDLVAGYRDNKTILIWDLMILNGEPLKRVIQTNELLYSLTVLKNDDLAIGQLYSNYDIVIRDSKTGSIKKTLNGHTSNVYRIMELENGNLISCSWDKTVIVWDFEKKSIIRTLEGHTDMIWCLDFSNCGKYIVSGSNDKTIIVWSTKTYLQLK